MPLITKVRKPEAEAECLDKVEKRFYVRWKIEVKPKGFHDPVVLHKAMVVEDPPRKVWVSFRHGDSYLIRKPWSYTIGHFTKHGGYLRSSIFFSYEKLKSASQHALLLVPLTNITYTNLSYVRPCICLGKEYVGGTSLESRAVRLNELFWSTRFNGEISIGSGAKPEWAETLSGETLVRKWEGKSKGDDLIAFRKARRTMGSVNAAIKWLSKFII